MSNSRTPRFSQSVRLRFFFSLACAALLATACVPVESATGDGGTTTVPTTVPDSGASVDSFIREVTDWESLPDTTGEIGTREISAPTEPAEEEVDGQAYLCTTRRVSLSANPREVVLSDPVNLWPGAILDGRAHTQGSLRTIAVNGPNRGPLGISIAGGGVLGIPAGVRTIVDEPVGSTVREGINGLVVGALDSEVVIGGGKASFTSTESHSASQAMLELGISAKYLGQSAKAKLNYDTKSSEHTYTAYFIQRLFTVAIDAPQNPSDFFDPSVSADELSGLGLGPNNPPVYIGAVSYGRILMYTMTSSASQSDIKGAIEYSYRGPALKVDAEVKARYQKALEESRIEIMAVGGPEAGLTNIIKSGDLSSYFDEELRLNQVEPISFTVNRLSDNQVAQVVDATEYDEKTCTIVEAGIPQPDHYWAMDGNFDEAITGAHLGGTPSRWGAGQFDGGAFFDGMTDSANTVGELGSDPEGKEVRTDGPFTIAAWINPAKNDFGTIISQLGERETGGDFAFRTSGGDGKNVQLEFWRRPGDGRNVEMVREARSVPMNKWSHVAVVYGSSADRESETMRLYVDGVAVERKVFITNHSPQRGGNLMRVGSSELAPLLNGSSNGHQYAFKGGIDELMVFDQALSQDQIAVMYQNFASYKEGIEQASSSEE